MEYIRDNYNEMANGETVVHEGNNFSVLSDYPGYLILHGNGSMARVGTVQNEDGSTSPYWVKMDYPTMKFSGKVGVNGEEIPIDVEKEKYSISMFNHAIRTFEIGKNVIPSAEYEDFGAWILSLL